MTRRFDRLDFLLATAIALAFGFVAALGLGLLPETVFDEVYYLPAAKQIADGEAPVEQTHPPMSKLVMALGYMAVRQLTHATDWPAVALGSRLAAIAAGMACLVGLYVLVRAMGDRRLPAVLATTLLALDGVFYVLARAAMTNVFAAAFTVWGVVGTWLAVSRGRAALLWPAGVAFGLAVACRHTAAIPLAICLLFALWQLRARVVTLLALGVTSVAAYAASYLQALWVATGGQPFTRAGAALFLELQRFSLHSHSGYSVPNLNASPWWSWPLMLAPTWLSFRLELSHDRVYPILALGNALVWWAAVPAMLFAAVEAWRKRNAALGLLAALAWGPWLAWAPLKSNASLMHYFFESLPAVCAILGILLARCPRPAIWGYMGLAVAWTIYFHPLQTYAPLAVDAYAARIPVAWDLAQRTMAFRKRMHLEDPKAYAAFNARYYPTLGGYLESTKQPGFPIPRPSAL